MFPQKIAPFSLGVVIPT